MDPSQLRAIALDHELTFAARGLIFCLSQLREEDRTMPRLLELAPTGKDHLRALLRELEQRGHLVRWRRRDRSGRIQRYYWGLPEIDREDA